MDHKSRHTVRGRVTKRVRDERKTEFPYGLAGDMAAKYNDDDVEGLTENESLDFVNLLTYLGKNIPKHKKLCTQNCRFKHSATPVLFTDDPSDLSSEDEEQKEHPETYLSATLRSGVEGDQQVMKEKKTCGLHQISTTLITPAPLWFEMAPGVMDYIPSLSEEEVSRKVKQELGFKYPPVMGKCMEQLVREIWTKIMEQSCDEVVDPGLDADYHSLVVDAQVRLVRFLQAYIHRRSEPGASERDAVADEKTIAREVLGRHHSDIDDATSSENEEELKPPQLNTPSNSSKLKTTPSEISDCEQSVSDSTNSDNDTESCKVFPQQLTRKSSQCTISDSKARELKTLTRRKRQTSSAGCPRGKVQRESLDLKNSVSQREQRLRRRSLRLKEVESSSSDDLGISSESDSCSQEIEGSSFERRKGKK